MKVELFENETVDDLQINGLGVIQKDDVFKFGTDAVLLSDFAAKVHSDTTLDLCTGNAIVPILMSAKTKTKEFCAIEIQEEIYSMAVRSVAMNGLSEKIRLYCENLVNAQNFFQKRSFDLVTCNPPYMKKNSAVVNDNLKKVIARHEIMCDLEDIINISSQLMKTTGHLVMVYRPQRLCELICMMNKYNIAPKRIRFVHKNAKLEPSLVLVDGLFGGKSDVRIIPPLIMFDENQCESEELKKIYGRNE